MAFIANCKKLPVNSLAQSSQTNRIKPLLVSQGDVLVEEHQDAHLVSCHVELMLGLGHLGLDVAKVGNPGGPRCLRSKMTWKIHHLVSFASFQSPFTGDFLSFPMVFLWLPMILPWKKQHFLWGFLSQPPWCLRVHAAAANRAFDLEWLRRRSGCWNHPRISRENVGSNSWNESGHFFQWSRKLQDHVQESGSTTAMMEHEKMPLKFEKKNKQMPVKAYGSEGHLLS